MATRKRRDFKRTVRQAVENPTLARAMGRATKRFAEHRAQAFEGVDFEALRAEVKAIKSAAINDLPGLIDWFTAEAEAVGARVHRATDASAANAIIAGLFAARGVQKVVKSKSMLTEEIGLNKELIARGLQVTETDLGEWIVQLAGDRPSHFVGPSIHIAREQVAELFSRVIGQPVPDDIPTMVDIARRQLRQAFIEADAGISGANIAVAESGTLVIVTNEGNGRLATTLPPIHVAVVGIEKIVPDLVSATTILRILPRSATGQKLTSYVSFITGPSRTADIEQTLTVGIHGPKEVHIVLVDNGRTQMRDDLEFREALHCIKCGACLNVCPIFAIVGGHVFGHVYQGGIGAVLTAFQAGLEHAVDPLKLCTTCQKCVPRCPAGINIPRMVLSLRRRVAGEIGLGRWERMGYRHLLADQGRLGTMAGVLRKAQALVGRGDMVRSLPLFLSSWTHNRSLPKLAREPLSRRWKDVRTPGATKKAVFYAGCMVEYAYPEIGEAVAVTLRKRGLDVSLAPSRGCCGYPAISAGDQESARRAAIETLQALESTGADYVVTACPTCSKALHEEYLRLFATDREWFGLASRIAQRSYDFSEFLVLVLREPNVEEVQFTAGRAGYHDSCHLRHGLGVADEPRQLVRSAGYDLVELEGSDACCGCAGLFSVKFPEVSQVMLQRKIESIETAGVDVVATDCPACIMQIRGGLDKRGSDVKVLHTAQIVAAREAAASVTDPVTEKQPDWMNKEWRLD